jgi:hypothetical protein
LLKDVLLLKPVECCGTGQISRHHIIIFGGLMHGEDKSTQTILFSVKSGSFTGIKSHLAFTDCFLLPPVVVRPVEDVKKAANVIASQIE